jgi:hypothetical protein
MTRATKYIEKRLCQGDIIRDVKYIEGIDEKEGQLDISFIEFPYVLVLTQDCDLNQDYTFRTEPRLTQDKLLLSVLVAPLYNAEHVFAGNHLQDIGIKSEVINKKETPGKKVIQNKDTRYHYISFLDNDNIEIVPSIIDFKHYFSVNLLYLEKLKETNFICKVSELYREDISQRFSSFLSRIGLPNT